MIRERGECKVINKGKKEKKRKGRRIEGDKGGKKYHRKGKMKEEGKGGE